MKKILSLLLILSLCIACSFTALAEERIIKVFVDGKEIQFDVHPISENGRTLVPMRYIFEALGAEVNWIGEENRAIATKGDITVDITPGSDTMYRNDAPITLDVPAKAIDGRTLVPARAVSEALDAEVKWNPEEYTVYITSSEEYTPGEYHYTELSDADLQLLRVLYPDFYTMYATDILFDNMAEYPEDVSELINSEDARIRMFADDVWNNMMAHTIINIQTESKDMYIFDIPEETEINSYTLMSDYIAITEKENMSSEGAIETVIETTPKGRKVLIIDYINDEIPILKTAVVSVENGFRYFYTEKAEGEGAFLTEVTKNGNEKIALCESTDNSKLLEAIDKASDNVQ